MTVIARDTVSSYESVRRLYEGDDFAGVLRLDPNARGSDPRVLLLLANSNLKLGYSEAAADVFVRLSSILDEKKAHFLKMAAMLYLKVGAHEKIAEIGPHAIIANPGDSRLIFDLMKVMNLQQRLDDVEKLLGHMDRRDPEQVYFIANFFKDRKKDAERGYRELVEGIENCPKDVFLKIQRFSISRNVCDFPVIRAFEQTMEEPRSAAAQQIFSHQVALDRLYWCDDEAVQAQPTNSSRILLAKKQQWSGQRIRGAISPASERLRIGYLSNDFGNEVVMMVFKQVLQHHDRNRFDITLFCYTDPESRKHQAKWPDELRAMIVPIRDMSDEGAAQAITTAKIDILVDLKGHTKADRLHIMNIADAPVTASYLGYPGSIVGAEIDYVISDMTVTPDSSKPHYIEKLCRLPEVQMPNDVLRPGKGTPTRRQDWGLPEGRIVFASFNGQQKITPRTLDLWCRIMRSVPDSVLWIATSHGFAAGNLATAFRACGIDDDRIIFASKVPHYSDHIARLGLADLALDTLPYNGHSTTADMLRGGLPVVTTRGNSYHSRVSWSLLQSCGIDELAVETDDEYCQLAESLARDPDRLTEIKTRLRQVQAVSPLFDPVRMARHLERAFELMADRARQGLAPDHIDVPALPR
ncbi:MAG: hypothetical protein JWM58_3228 [Rhizobium sp.]|nr:hypothetical protein [Rhizobium sp.]